MNIVRGLFGQQKEDDGFWLPKPKRFDFMTLAILIPVIASAVGLFLMAVESFVFVQFGSLSKDYPELRSVIALLSGFFMAFGGEVGTVANNVEIFSKYIKSRLESTRYEWDIVTAWDWAGFGVSWLSTTASVIIASSTREYAGTSWQEFVSEWMVLPLMIVAVGDVVFGTIELGLRFGTFDARMRNWIGLRKKEQDEVDYLKRLDNGEVVSEDKAVRCWCGKELKNEMGYHRHQVVHKEEAREYETARLAYDGMREKYEDTIHGADIDFPTLVQIVEWKEGDENDG
jgi:hypothetical protein